MLSGEGGKKAASYLIQQGADIFMEDEGNRCALEIAAGEGDHEMINVLIASGIHLLSNLFSFEAGFFLVSPSFDDFAPRCFNKIVLIKKV